MPVSHTNVKEARLNLQEYLTKRAGQAHTESKNFEASWIERRTLQECEKALPTFEGKSLSELISHLPEDAVLLDVGCGDAAVCLLEIFQKNPHLICHGVTYPVERNNLEHFEHIQVFREDMDKFLTNISNIYDLIYSVQAFRYSPDYLRTLKKAYRALKQGGILLVDMILVGARPIVDERGRLVIPSQLEKILRDSGHQVEVRSNLPSYNHTFSIAIRKTEPRLKLPIQLIRYSELKKLYRSHTDEHDLVGADLSTDVSYVYQLKV